MPSHMYVAGYIQGQRHMHAHSYTHTLTNMCAYTCTIYTDKHLIEHILVGCKKKSIDGRVSFVLLNFYFLLFATFLQAHDRFFQIPPLLSTLSSRFNSLFTWSPSFIHHVPTYRRQECPEITYIAMGFRPHSFPVGEMYVKGIGRLKKVEKKLTRFFFSIAS